MKDFAAGPGADDVGIHWELEFGKMEGVVEAAGNGRAEKLTVEYEQLVEEVVEVSEMFEKEADVSGKTVGEKLVAKVTGEFVNVVACASVMAVEVAWRWTAEAETNHETGLNVEKEIEVEAEDFV